MSNPSQSCKALLAFGAVVVLQPFTVLAVDYEFIYNGAQSSALWSNTNAAVWSPAAPAGGPTASDNVTIPDQALKALGIDGARSANNFTFLKADAFNVVGGAAGTNSLSIIGDLVKSGGGLLTFRASGSNLLALNVGNLVISNGEVAMGSTSVTLASLDVSGATSLSGSGSALSLNIAEGGTASLGALTMGTGTVVSIRNVSSGTATTAVTSLAGAGIIRNAFNGGTGRGILVIDSTNSTSFGGTIIDNSSANPDSKLEIVKAGSGTQVFTGTNTYTGATTVTAGVLHVNGSTTSTTTVQSGATLGGSGSVDSVVVESGGTIAPGNSPGTLTITNGLTWAGGGNYEWQIFNVSGTAGETDTWDLINVTGGTWDITGLSSTNKFNINLWSLAGLPNTTGVASGFDAAANYSWKILGSVGLTGTFSSDLFSINTSATNGTGGFIGATGMFALELNNDDLFLTYTGSGAPIPEPGTWAVAALLAAAAGWRFTRRSLGSGARVGVENGGAPMTEASRKSLPR